MMKKSNQLKIGVVISYLSMIAGIVISLVYTPVMLRQLGDSEYGVYSLSSSVINCLSLLSLGFGSSYIRFYYRYKSVDDEEGINKLNSLFFVVFCIISLCALLGGLFIVFNTELVLGGKLTASELDTARVLMCFMTVNVTVTFINTIYDNFITAHEEFFYQKSIKLLITVLNPLLTLPLLFLGFKSVAITFIATLLTFSKLFLNMHFCLKKLNMKFDFKDMDFNLLKEIGAFSFFIFINMIIDQINWNVDKFILGKYVGSIAVAVYSIGAQINTHYLTLSSAISGVFIPRVNRLVTENEDTKQVSELFTRVGRIQFMVLWLVLFGFALYGQYFIGVWAGDGYEDAYYIALLLIIPVTIPLIQNLGIEIQRAMNMHQFRSYTYLFMAIINVGISIILAKAYGGIGVALGTAISLIVGNGIIMNLYYQFKMKLDIIGFWKSILRFVPALLISSIIAIIFKNCLGNLTFIKFAVGCLFTAVDIVVCYYLLAMNNYEKNLIKKIPAKLLKRG